MNGNIMRCAFRKDIDFKIEVINIGSNRYVIFVPIELTGGVESRIVLHRSADDRWWLTDEHRTFRRESEVDTTIFSEVELSLEVSEKVSSKDLSHFIVAIKRLGSQNK